MSLLTKIIITSLVSLTVVEILSDTLECQGKRKISKVMELVVEDIIKKGGRNG